LRYAQLIEQAGADGLELNLYQLTTDLEESGQEVERRDLEVVRTVKGSVHIPVAVKLSPFYSSIANFAARLDQTGADALVLFNRFYQPDIDVEQQELLRVNLSSPSELLLRLRWIGALAGRVRPALAATGGVETATDVVKAVMAGAQVTQMVSALLRHGPNHLRRVRADLERWLDEHDCASLQQIQGSMSMQRCPDPAGYQRANYIRLLQSWRGDEVP
jgi:dihydroorotate dehydrogenase (fumarate)